MRGSMSINHIEDQTWTMKVIHVFHTYFMFWNSHNKVCVKKADVRGVFLLLYCQPWIKDHLFPKSAVDKAKATPAQGDSGAAPLHHVCPVLGSRGCAVGAVVGARTPSPTSRHRRCDQGRHLRRAMRTKYVECSVAWTG